MTRVAILGFGLAGEVFHAPFVAVTPGLEVTAILTRDPERRARAAARHPEARVVDDPGEAIAAAELVVVATPNDTHVPLALRALEAGKAVVIDKPLAPTVAEARRVRDAAAASGRPVAVFHNRRWDGDFLTVRRLAGEGALGDVVRLESRFERWRPAVDADRWREQPGGGLLLDLGPHLVDQALVLLGPAVRVYAEVDRRRPGACVDDDDFVALDHAGGARSHLWMGALAADAAPRFRVRGTAGAYVVGGLDPQEAALRGGRWPDEPGWGAVGEASWGAVTTGGEPRPVPTERGDYAAFYAAMAAALDGRAPVPVTLDEALDAMAVLEAAAASARERRVVELGVR